MTYGAGFVFAVTTANRDAFLAHCDAINPVIKAYGALRVAECWGIDVPDGKVTSFPMAVQKTADETVVFSWIEWPDKAARDKGVAGMIEDPRMDPGNMQAPFDGKRMILGGFEMIYELA